MVAVSDLNKILTDPATDLAKKKHGSADLLTPIHSPQPVTPFLSGAPLLKKILDPPLAAEKSVSVSVATFFYGFALFCLFIKSSMASWLHPP